MSEQTETVTLTVDQLFDQRERALVQELERLKAQHADTQGALNEVRRLRAMTQTTPAPNRAARRSK